MRNCSANHEGNKHLIADSGGIDVLLAAIRQTEAPAAVAEHASAAIGNLATTASNRQSIAEAGGIPEVLNAMERHATNDGELLQGTNCAELLIPAVCPIALLGC